VHDFNLKKSTRINKINQTLNDKAYQYFKDKYQSVKKTPTEG
jgi:hypothetical protein